VVEALDQPRASFAGHTPGTPWTALQLAYFVGTAMWTYLTQPFTFILPGFETAELEPWQENGEQQRRLRVAWPNYLATHSTVQTVYFGDDGLIRREDYDVEILGGSVGAHYMSGYTRVAGIMIPTMHRIFRGRRRAGHSPSRCWSRSISARSHSHSRHYANPYATVSAGAWPNGLALSDHLMM